MPPLSSGCPQQMLFLLLHFLVIFSAFGLRDGNEQQQQKLTTTLVAGEHCAEAQEWPLNGRALVRDYRGRVLLLTFVSMEKCHHECELALKRLDSLHDQIPSVRVLAIAPVNEPAAEVRAFAWRFPRIRFEHERKKSPVWKWFAASHMDQFVFDRCSRNSSLLLAANNSAASGPLSANNTINALKTALHQQPCGACEYDWARPAPKWPSLHPPVQQQQKKMLEQEESDDGDKYHDNKLKTKHRQSQYLQQIKIVGGLLAAPAFSREVGSPQDIGGGRALFAEQLGSGNGRQRQKTTNYQQRGAMEVTQQQHQTAAVHAANTNYQQRLPSGGAMEVAQQQRQQQVQREQQRQLQQQQHQRQPQQHLNQEQLQLQQQREELARLQQQQLERERLLREHEERLRQHHQQQMEEQQRRQQWAEQQQQQQQHFGQVQRPGQEQQQQQQPYGQRQQQQQHGMSAPGAAPKEVAISPPTQKQPNQQQSTPVQYANDPYGDRYGFGLGRPQNQQQRQRQRQRPVPSGMQGGIDPRQQLSQQHPQMLGQQQQQQNYPQQFQPQPQQAALLAAVPPPTEQVAPLYPEGSETEDYYGYEDEWSTEAPSPLLQIPKPTGKPVAPTTPSLQQQDKNFGFELPCTGFSDDNCFQQQTQLQKSEVHRCCRGRILFTDQCIQGKCSNMTTQLCCIQRFLQAKLTCCSDERQADTGVGDHFSRCCFDNFVDGEDPCCPRDYAAEQWRSVHELCLPNVELDLSEVKVPVPLLGTSLITEFDFGKTDKWRFECRYGGHVQQYSFFEQSASEEHEAEAGGVLDDEI